MRFLIIGDLLHKLHDNKIYTYGPYVKEINIWLKYVDEVEIVAPTNNEVPNPIDLPYIDTGIQLYKVPALSLNSWSKRFMTLIFLPYVVWQLFRAMHRADHIHIRCPNNMGLLGAMIQVLFPKKRKTVKYANNWDPNHPQPWTYRLQKKILSSELFTKNIDVLVYGEWKDQTANIKSFFTATYHDSEKKFVEPRTLTGIIKLVYVGHMGVNKRPILCAETVKRLTDIGYEVKLDMFGEGPELETLDMYIQKYGLQSKITLHGNQNAEVVKACVCDANFLILASKSEGWPKVIAEAMFWGCVPLTTDVSCVKYMIGEGSRGRIVKPEFNDVVNAIVDYVNKPEDYAMTSRKALEWSQQYTLESFENSIKDLIQ